MMGNKIPKYVATPQFEEELIQYSGKGDTAEEALKDLNDQTILDYAEHYDIPDGKEIEVQVWTAGTPEEAGWCEDDADPDWAWCLVDRVSTHQVVFQQANHPNSTS